MEKGKKCFNCGWQNPIYAKLCEFCNVNLPMIFQEEVPDRINFVEKTVCKKIVDWGWYSPKFKRLLNGVEKLLAGLMSEADFRDIVEELHSNVINELTGKEGLRKNLKIYVRNARSDKADEVMELCMDALYSYDDAFNEIKLYFEDKDPSHIDIGMELALDAKNKLCESLSIMDREDGEYKRVLKRID